MNYLTSHTSTLRWLLALLVIIALTGCGQGISGGIGQGTANQPVKDGVVSVEIGYLNHPPTRGMLADVDRVLSKYGDRVSVKRYDLDTSEGDAFADAKNLVEHTPLAIFINGSMEFKLNERRVRFYSFPQGQGTFMVADGNWTIEDLDAVLALVTGVNK